MQGIHLFRNKVYLLLNEGARNQKYRWIAKAIEILIVLNVLAVVLETFESIDKKYGNYFEAFEIFTVCIFLTELILRLMVADLSHPARNHFISVLKLIFSPVGLVDILAILPFFIPFMMDIDLRHLRILRLARLLRVFRVQKYNHSLRLIIKILNDKKTELLGTMLIACSVLIVSSTLMYYVEHDINPEFPDIINAFWWCISTLTTIGYGDVVPITYTGKLIGSVVAVMGVLLMAIPIGILSTGFVQNLEELNKRKRLMSIRNLIKDAFRKKYVPELGCEVRRGALTIEAIRISLEISDEEIVKLAEGKNEFRYRILQMYENGMITRRFCLEYRDCNTEYGTYHHRESSLTIVCAESHSKQSIGYMAYCLSEMLKTNYLSNEFFGEEAETTDEIFGDKGLDREGTYNFTLNPYYTKEEDASVPVAFREWKKHLIDSSSKSDYVVILDKSTPMEGKIAGIVVHVMDKHSTMLANSFVQRLRSELQNTNLASTPVDLNGGQAPEHFIHLCNQHVHKACIHITIPKAILMYGLFPLTGAVGRTLKSI